MKIYCSNEDQLKGDPQEAHFYSLVESELAVIYGGGLETSFNQGISLVKGPVCGPRGVYMTNVVHQSRSFVCF